MMKAAPAPAFVVAQAEVLVVTLDALTHLGFKHHALQRCVLGQRGQPGAASPANWARNRAGPLISLGILDLLDILICEAWRSTLPPRAFPAR